MNAARWLFDAMCLLGLLGLIAALDAWWEGRTR